MIGAVARRGRRAPSPTQGKFNRPGVCSMQLVGGVGGLGGVNAHLTVCNAILARLALFLIDLSIFQFAWLFGAFCAVIGDIKIFFNFFSNFIDDLRSVCYSIIADGASLIEYFNKVYDKYTRE